ncbi:MAG: acetyl-CoA decarbonylase/synthase complex subunit gamma [Gracilibacteraceae bacterium]|jgi:acetyl-CoA decarbonylase/synthase complex subunit gamma|nr:acetyl-CoA decarbonylase/synthase complex subunit gamma [Gracilibacteraceae bacterium]
MALKGLDIFKLTPKTNCKDCGIPTCMAFAMKVAQGSIAIEVCPHMSAESLAVIGAAAAPPMRSLKIGAGGAHVLGGETVLFRHEKTFAAKTLYGVALKPETAAAALPEIMKVDYERISERMFVELLYVEYTGDRDAFLDLVQTAKDTGRALAVESHDAAAAKEAMEILKGLEPLLIGADAANYAAMDAVAKEYRVALGVSGRDLDELYDTVLELEKLGNKDLVLDVGHVSVKDAFAAAVQLRRAAVKDGDRSAGYPSFVNAGKLAPGDPELQLALASVFTLKYGSVIILEGMSYAQALPLYGLRQNIFTDPQKPMTVTPGIYPINGGGENAVCATTVDFALTYFIISGELERSGVPCNLLISDAGGYSVLTAWAAGKLSAQSLGKFFKEFAVEDKIKNRTLLIPGKVAVLKGEIEESLPGWRIVVAPNEAVSLVKYMKELEV